MYQRILIFSALFLFLAGCSQNVKVSGTVKLSDGTPVSGGMVIFISGERQGKGNINKDGRYTLSFTGKNDGVPAGDYTVLITGVFFKPEGLKTEDEMDTGSRPMIDLKYAEAETSPLKCTVPNAEGYDLLVEPSKEYLNRKK